ncbi:MAG: hypothetical protein LBT67_02250 [Holosporaceae bacterium]|nr:hypothetical protein [Holosporaceae bacterium]
MKKMSFYFPALIVGVLFLEDASAGTSMPSFLGGGNKEKEGASPSADPAGTKSESAVESPAAEPSTTAAPTAATKVPPAAETPVVTDTSAKPSAAPEAATQELAEAENKEKLAKGVLEEEPQSAEKIADEIKKAEAAT